MVGHETRLRGYSADQIRGQPSILERQDTDFIPALLDELKAETGRARLATMLAARKDANGNLTLLQPVHRTFNIALVEAYCATPGSPRLDPRKIESAGLVIRRKRSSGANWEGWMHAPDTVASKDKPRLRGWVDIDKLVDGDAVKADPDPKRRPPRLSAGHPVINQKLGALMAGENLAEEIAPLFVAPPEVCAAAQRTVLYGLVPVTSSDQSEAPAAIPDFLDTAAAPGEKSAKDQIREHLSGYLRAQGTTAALPRPEETIDASWPQAIDDAQARVAAGGAAGDDLNLVNFALLLRQLVFEFDAFGDGAQSQALFNRLNAIELVLAEDAWTGEVLQVIAAGDFLKAAAKIIVERDAGAPATVMPLRWPALDAAAEEALLVSIAGCLAARAPLVVGREGRFDNSAALYAVQAFIRVKREDGCPPVTVWSEPSAPFVIAPWYDGADAAPVQIPLPDAGDRELLKKLKPNVAFVVPESLMNMLNGYGAKDLADGKGKAGGAGIGLGWICSFNIPVITLCAFIVLNVFLQLFDIIFRWMMFIKICIPVPKNK
jgi:hypothetical protein